MNKKLILTLARFYIALTVLIAVFGSSYVEQSIYAKEQTTESQSGGQTDPEQNIPQYDATNSVVQVVLLYQDDNSVYHIIQSGSGVVVDDTTVITNRSLTVMSDKLKTEAGEYLSKALEKSISFIQTEEGSGEVASFTLAIVEEADIYNIATVELSSKDWNFAILKLSKPLVKEFAVLGDSDQIEIDSSVSVVGFPSSKYSDPKSFTVNDIIKNDGKCVNLNGGDISFDAKLVSGNTGGALTDEYGRLVGITVYKSNENEVYTALPINRIKAYLDRSNVAYKEDLSVIEDATSTEESTDESTEEGTLEPSNTFTTDKRDLYRAITEAQLICDSGDSKVYTEESLRDLELQLEYAKSTYDDEVISQEIIDEDTANLEIAIDGLREIEKDNTVLIIVIVNISIFVIAGIIVLIIFLMKRSRKIKKNREAQQKIKVMPSAVRNNAPANLEYQNNVSAINKMNASNSPSSQLYAQFDAKTNNKQFSDNGVEGDSNGTTVLRSDVGTTILNSFSSNSGGGYLHRNATGDNIAIDSEEFIIGKGPQGVSYAINSNSNVSRMHAKIVRKNDEFFIEDMGSTNFTYVNNSRVAPGYKQVLKNNDVIYLADEEFTFMTRG